MLEHESTNFADKSVRVTRRAEASGEQGTPFETQSQVSLTMKPMKAVPAGIIICSRVQSSGNTSLNLCAFTSVYTRTAQ